MQLLKGIKDSRLAVKYQNLLLRGKIINYKEMFVEPPIYIRYSVLTILICTSMLAIELFIVHNLLHFMDVSLSTYLYFSIYRFVAYP